MGSSQTTMGNDGSLWRITANQYGDRMARFVIQETLSFDHFDNHRMTTLIKETLQPRYCHVKQLAYGPASVPYYGAPSARKGANYCVVPYDHGSLPVAFGSPSTTLIAERIDKLERKMIDEKFMLVDDDGKQLSKVASTVNANSDSEVEDVFNETAGFMASTCL
ncbi:hypothetical protein Tco_0522969 [Tanacetum coccineum]